MSLPEGELLRSWVGRSEEESDVASLAPARLLAATLDRDTSPRIGDALPLTWHWLYFLPAVLTRDLGEDGHPRRGGFMPPIDLPRRMWAGSRIEYRSPILLGDPICRSTVITDVTAKQGRTGALVFVRIETRISTERGLALIEERDVVFRNHPFDTKGGFVPEQAPRDVTWRDSRRADEVQLFRYSALTFNSHRIHYDAPYASHKERYPSLIVHGPLQATWIAELLAKHHPPSGVRTCSFRAVRAVHVGEECEVAGRADNGKLQLWVANQDHALAMSAQVELT